MQKKMSSKYSYDVLHMHSAWKQDISHISNLLFRVEVRSTYILSFSDSADLLAKYIEYVCFLIFLRITVSYQHWAHGYLLLLPFMYVYNI